MRFIVELYRLILIATFAITLIFASFVVVTVARTPDLASGASGYVTIAMIIGAVFIILSIGMTATFISMHDRFQSMATSAADIAESAASIAESAAEIVSLRSEKGNVVSSADSPSTT